MGLRNFQHFLVTYESFTKYLLFFICLRNVMQVDKSINYGRTGGKLTGNIERKKGYIKKNLIFDRVKCRLNMK